MTNSNETAPDKGGKGEEGADEGEKDLELEEGEEEEDAGGKKGGEDDKGGKKPDETPEAKKSRLERQLEQHRKKHPELYDDGKAKPEAKPKPDKKGELDYGQQAFLIANGIKEDDEQALAQRVMTETGKSLKDVVKSKYFQTELKELRDENAAADALPSSKRANASSPSSVDYWIAKGGLPPNTPENRELRTKIVEARVKQKKDTNQFSSTPVVGG